MRRTKIICTMGPTTEGRLTELIENGMDAARVNFSHEDYSIHASRIQELKEAREKLGKPIPLIIDTKGPEIRTGMMKSGTVLKNGQEFRLGINGSEGDINGVSLSCDMLFKHIKKDDSIFIDDGRIKLKVTGIDGTEIITTVISGGPLSNKKGVNVPGRHTGIPFLSDKDIKDIRFGIKHGFDYIALSFVKDREDVELVRRILNEEGSEDIRIIAKIEHESAVRNIDEIIDASDGIMIGRGDLGIEMSFSALPGIQKKLIRKCYLSGKPVITATQMLESMTQNPLPSRAEVSDVANAIYDGTSAVMLSGETAMGSYPIRSLKTMVEIVESTESDIDYKKRYHKEDWFFTEKSIVNIIGQSTTVASFNLDAKAIIVPTRSGNSARMISRFRPSSPIIALTISPRIERQLNMSWGIYPLRTVFKGEINELFNNLILCAEKTGLLKNGDLVIITAGIPTGKAGKTNMLKAHIMGDDVL